MKFLSGGMIKNERWTYYILEVHEDVATLVNFNDRNIISEQPLMEFIDIGYTYYPPSEIEFIFKLK